MYSHKGHISDITDIFRTYFGQRDTLHDDYNYIIWQLLGDFGDYLAISCEVDGRKNNLLDITDLFRSHFGHNIMLLENKKVMKVMIR